MKGPGPGAGLSSLYSVLFCVAIDSRDCVRHKGCKSTHNSSVKDWGSSRGRIDPVTQTLIYIYICVYEYRCMDVLNACILTRYIFNTVCVAGKSLMTTDHWFNLLRVFVCLCVCVFVYGLHTWIRVLAIGKI